MIKLLLFFILICIINLSKIKTINIKNDKIINTKINIGKQHYSFLKKNNEKDEKDEKEEHDSNDNEKSDASNNKPPIKNENNDQNTNNSTPTNNDDISQYGTHDNNGKFIPSYQGLSNDILSANNALEKSAQYIKVACSHILKLLEFLPQDKLASYYVKLEEENIYLKDIGTSCHKIYFSLNKLSMSIIVLNAKIFNLMSNPQK